ncbi:MAG: hypothetical protein R2942_13760 [Ignavibacteria bacterium]
MSVSTAGDVNGDGYSDVIGAYDTIQVPEELISVMAELS